MTTFAIASPLAQTSTATFDAWINEVQNALVTQCGLTQLSASMDSGQMAVPSTQAWSAVGSTDLGYWMFAFNDTLSSGPLVTGTALAALTAGTGYNGGSPGTFTGVQGSGGANSTARYTVVLGASGVITSITPTTAGTGSFIGDKITITSANMVTAGAAAGGGSSGFAFVNQLTSAASPVVIRLGFGTGTSSLGTQPQMFITLGTSWTSNGVVGAAQNGAATVKSTVMGGTTSAVSTSASYVSRYCYNATLGFLGIGLKYGAQTVGRNDFAFGGLFIYRSNDSSGNPTGNSVSLLTTFSTNTNGGASASGGQVQTISYTNNILYPNNTTGTVGPVSSNSWFPVGGGAGTIFVYGQTSTLESGTVFVLPIFVCDPVIRYSAFIGVALNADLPTGVTASLALIGATPLTFMGWGSVFASGNNGMGGNNAGGMVIAAPWQ